MNEDGTLADSELERLARYIAEYLKADFKEIHLSGNLMRNITVGRDIEDNFVVRIPAIRYDIAKYLDEGVLILQPSEGSYAEEVNKRGGFSRAHTNYVERAIWKAISAWASSLGITFYAKERETL